MRDRERGRERVDERDRDGERECEWKRVKEDMKERGK